jgi:hypothetical protein
MSTNVTLYNFRPNGLAHPEFPRVAALSVASKTIKQVNADDYATHYDRLAAFGVSVSQNGTLLAGTTIVTDSIYTTLTTDYIVIVDLLAVTRVVTLATSGSLSDGRKMWVYLRSTTGGAVTLTAGGGDTILGGASVSLSGAGAVRRIELDGTNWVAQ